MEQHPTRTGSATCNNTPPVFRLTSPGPGDWPRAAMPGGASFLFLRGGNLPFPRKLRETLPSFSFLWNVIRLPVTRSVGLKGQGGPGVSETRGGARGVICRRHEAPPRVTERPSATLRLRHPGSPAPNKKDPHQLVFASLLSRVVVGGKVFVWRPACGRQRRLLWADPQVVRSRARIAEQRSRGSPLSCV